MGIALGLVALVAALALHRARRREQGWEPATPVVRPLDVGGLKAPLTAIVFKSRLCYDCQFTPGIVREAAPEIPVIAIDVSKRPDLASRLGLTETPTLLLVDERGRIRYARVGNPEPAELWTYAREAWDSLEAEGEIVRSPRASPAQ